MPPTVSDGHDDDVPLLGSEHHFECVVYKRRWYMLFAFTSMSFMQGAMPNVWSVIAESVEPAFGWTDSTISLMMNWIYITYLAAMFPMAWIIDYKGLRPAVLVSAALIVAGCALRCVSTHAPLVTWLAHFAHILIGLAGPVCFTAGPAISAAWFPVHQRATATAISIVMGYAGAAGSFIVGDGPHGHQDVTSKLLALSNKFINIYDLCESVADLECGVMVVIFIVLLSYFPSKPDKPPSISSASPKLNFHDGFKALFRRENANFWLIGLPYGLSVSIYGVWSALFDVNLKDVGITERDAGWLGFYAVSAGCVAAVIMGRLADSLQHYMKEMLLILNAGCVCCTFWFIMMVEGYLPSSHVLLYTAGILQCICNNGPIPLYYELAIESTYPIAEVVTSSLMTIIYNILPICFLGVFLIPNLGLSWMNWCMYGAVLLAYPLQVAFKVKLNRLHVDEEEDLTPGSVNAPVDDDPAEC
ncbi:hypothetical protein CAPTEDRAFT_140636 [Capitella teleta]|uniref:Major facilitator superfamily (MFS) profile domain-containing protein n=1 Tax=Capitella teleta TaxID=283909 RepID=R7UP25_CAPTE|nr:hypothetical protein CAPTEDRAFT_140636 [Capitella teleta]|eukprot:ELU05131.1 hypothetical protein CAPTEDRAFT_140636 [Capitella teleta]